jgi:hypothetical protein
MVQLREVGVDDTQVLQELNGFEGNLLRLSNLSMSTLWTYDVLKDEVESLSDSLCEGFIVEYLLAPPR